MQGVVEGAPDHVCPLGGVRVLSRVLSRVLRGSCLLLGGVCPGCCQGGPDYVCQWAVLGCCAIGRCQGAVQGAPGIVFAIGQCLSRVLSGCSGSCLPLHSVRVLSRVLCRGAVQGAPDHVCHWAVSGCYPGCSGSCLPLGGVRLLSRGAVDGCCPGCSVCYWAVSGCC